MTGLTQGCLFSIAVAAWAIFATFAGMAHTMNDDRAILSDMRDAQICATWPNDTACTLATK